MVQDQQQNALEMPRNLTDSSAQSDIVHDSWKPAGIRRLPANSVNWLRENSSGSKNTLKHSRNSRTCLVAIRSKHTSIPRRNTSSTSMDALWGWLQPSRRENRGSSVGESCSMLVGASQTRRSGTARSS